MITRVMVDNFLKQKKLAVVGVSRNGKKFGNTVFRELKARGYQVYPVNPLARKVEDSTCYPDLKSIPETMDGAVIIIPSEETEKVIQDAIKADIKNIWIQQGSESQSAIDLCEKNQIRPITGECILMYADPVKFPHNLHRWFWKIFGKLPR